MKGQIGPRAIILRQKIQRWVRFGVADQARLAKKVIYSLILVWKIFPALWNG